MNSRYKSITIASLTTLEKKHLDRAKEIRSVIEELQMKLNIETKSYRVSMNLPDKILCILGESGVYMKAVEISDEIARRDEREDVTGFTQDVSKRLFKLKKAEKVKSFQEGNSRASTVWGLPEW
jgi:vesicle coat complex subunit